MQLDSASADLKAGAFNESFSKKASSKTTRGFCPSSCLRMAGAQLQIHTVHTFAYLKFTLHTVEVLQLERRSGISVPSK